jgi:hypothetical protein
MQNIVVAAPPQSTDKRIVIKIVQKTGMEIFPAEQWALWENISKAGEVCKMITTNFLDTMYPFQLIGFIDEYSYQTFISQVNAFLIQTQKVSNDVAFENSAKNEALINRKCCFCFPDVRITDIQLMSDNIIPTPEQMQRINQCVDDLKNYSDTFARQIVAQCGVHLVIENGFYIFCLP